MVELIPKIGSIHLPPFLPPIKKPRITQNPDSLPIVPIPKQPSPQNPLVSSIQGARHKHYDTTLQEHLGNLQFRSEPQQHPPISTGPVVPNSPVHEDGSNSSNERNDETNPNTAQFMLFGKLIVAEPQLSPSINSSLDLSSNKLKFSNENDSAFHQKCLEDNSPCDSIPEIVLCKVFMESHDIGCTLNLSAFDSYEPLYERFENMFGVEKSELIGHILYQHKDGSIKHIEEEPFEQFMKAARRLIISRYSSYKSIGR